MMPFSLGEATRTKPPPCFLTESTPEDRFNRFEEQISAVPTSEVQEAYRSYLHLGPFPEPYLRQSDRFSRKWHLDYLSLVVREDLKDISRVTEIDKVENLLILLPSRIMAPLSMANLAAELEVAHTTVKAWLEQVRRLYLVFPVPPWTRKISRGLRREKKWYFVDWYYAPEGPARLEDLMAASLYRACLKLTDMGFGDYQLYYLRTLDKREIDFIVAIDRIPVMAVEIKVGDISLSHFLRDRKKWFHQLPTLGVQIVDRRGILEKLPDRTWVVSVDRFLPLLG